MNLEETELRKIIEFVQSREAPFIVWSRVHCCALDPYGYCFGHPKWAGVRAAWLAHVVLCATIERLKKLTHRCAS